VREALTISAKLTDFFAILQTLSVATRGDW